MPKKITLKERRLIRRYLIWSYKTTHEALDRIDRKFTQLLVDRSILRELLRKKDSSRETRPNDYRKRIDDFKRYMAQKEKDAYRLKFSDKNPAELNPDYVYLKNRLTAIERSIVYFFSQKELTRIQSLYEEEMTRRILEAREHN